MTPASERLPEATNPFSARLVIILIAIAIVSFAAVMALMAWSPDLARKDRPGATPYSRSASGYAGLIDMLESDRRAVTVSRRSDLLHYSDGRLMVLTLPLYGRGFEIDELAGPALIVLPKWSFLANPARRAFELDTRLASKDAVDAMLGLVEEDASLHRLRNPGSVNTPFGTFTPDFDHEMQVIKSDTLEEIIGVPGGQLLSKLPDRDIYVLSDPDLLNNFGLARVGNALMGLSLFAYLDNGRQDVVFDATIHGFESSGSLLKTLLDIPFLGATLVALATMLLIGWAAAIRFGAPEREAPAFPPGKLALADNSADLIASARREARMAPGYLSLTRRALARDLGLPKTLSEAEIAALLDRMGEQTGLDDNWSRIGGALSEPAHNRDDLRHKARALWRWRMEMTHGNK
ncbi:DUF4350 domain-containing protein [Henriciella mobilis]|uniref:DUF4350 domain-containing protein n=1 Tax=Henriciella mobilis TaxID=2305467 RepID=A0A399RNU1_9PROT|nr:DUF4350 domain-containing protein [Henriciella mobilis]RIJ32868.1 hypothetical protein D1223_03200 [Henriciella mobilis]